MIGGLRRGAANFYGPLWTWSAMEADLKLPQDVVLSLRAVALRPSEALRWDPLGVQLSLFIYIYVYI